MEANDPGPLLIWTPEAWLAGIMYKTTRHCSFTRYIRCGSHGFRDDIFFSSSHCKSMGAIDLRGIASLDARGLIDSMQVGDY